jgi:hypothetical protein
MAIFSAWQLNRSLFLKENPQVVFLRQVNLPLTCEVFCSLEPFLLFFNIFNLFGWHRFDVLRLRVWSLKFIFWRHLPRIKDSIGYVYNVDVITTTLPTRALSRSLELRFDYIYRNINNQFSGILRDPGSWYSERRAPFWTRGCWRAITYFWRLCRTLNFILIWWIIGVLTHFLFQVAASLHKSLGFALLMVPFHLALHLTFPPHLSTSSSTNISTTKTSLGFETIPTHYAISNGFCLETRHCECKRYSNPSNRNSSYHLLRIPKAPTRTSPQNLELCCMGSASYRNSQRTTRPHRRRNYGTMPAAYDM